MSRPTLAILIASALATPLTFAVAGHIEDWNRRLQQRLAKTRDTVKTTARLHWGLARGRTVIANARINGTVVIDTDDATILDSVITNTSTCIKIVPAASRALIRGCTLSNADIGVSIVGDRSYGPDPTTDRTGAALYAELLGDPRRCPICALAADNGEEPLNHDDDDWDH